MEEQIFGGSYRAILEVFPTPQSVLPSLSTLLLLFHFLQHWELVFLLSVMNKYDHIIYIILKRKTLSPFFA